MRCLIISYHILYYIAAALVKTALPSGKDSTDSNSQNNDAKNVEEESDNASNESAGKDENEKRDGSKQNEPQMIADIQNGTSNVASTKQNEKKVNKVIFMLKYCILN